MHSCLDDGAVAYWSTKQPALESAEFRLIAIGKQGKLEISGIFILSVSSQLLCMTYKKRSMHLCNLG